MSGTIRFHIGKRDPRRLWLPEEECVRLTKREYDGVMFMLSAASFTAHACELLKGSSLFDKIGHGWARLKMTQGSVQAITDDMCGATVMKQRKQLMNTLTDYSPRMMPKLTPWTQNMVIEREVMAQLLNVASEKCLACVEDNISCQKCALYQVLEAIHPPEEHGGFICPYADKRFA